MPKPKHARIIGNGDSSNNQSNNNNNDDDDDDAAAGTTSAAASTANTNNTNINNNASKRAQVFQALAKEMELAEYATCTISGNKLKRVPRKERVERTLKRKELEREDWREMAIEADDYEDGDDVGDVAGDIAGRKRLRGSKVAFEDVVLKSMPLSNTTNIAINCNNTNTTTNNDNDNNNMNGKESAADAQDDNNHDNDDNDDDEEEDDERFEILDEVVALGAEYLNLNEDNEEDDDEEDEEEEDDEEIDDEDDDEEDDENGFEQEDLENDNHDHHATTTTITTTTLNATNNIGGPTKASYLQQQLQLHQQQTINQQNKTKANNNNTNNNNNINNNNNNNSNNITNTTATTTPSTTNTTTTTSKTIRSTTYNTSKNKKTKSLKKRLMHRLRDFSSHRLAERHGEAISAHVRGMSETAVRKLREVAKAAPGAPQIYSSLGLVYESMLLEVEEKMKMGMEMGDDHQLQLQMEKKRNVSVVNISTDGNDAAMDSPETELENEGNDDNDDAAMDSMMVYLDMMKQRLELAQKAYGSYHVAALLCKRDFTLWERSGDAANKVASIYSDTMEFAAKHPAPITNNETDTATANNGTSQSSQGEQHPSAKEFNPYAGTEKMRLDRKVWQEHALSAYESADNLRPPGVDIPCKLAQLHMDLGNYTGALSILTDLKTKSKGKSVKNNNRSEMEESYGCWLLYADLMMKIGFECMQWNEVQDPEKAYMFKRWLRKHSRTFEWKERRLQALCLAFEAAAGSASCGKLVEWMKTRAANFDSSENEDAAVLEDDAGEESKTDESGEKAYATANKNVREDETEKSDQPKLDTKDGSTKCPGDNPALEGQKSRKSSYDRKRDDLVNLNKAELRKFDIQTKEMNLVDASIMYRNRVSARAAIVEKHRSAIRELARKKYREEQEQKNDTTMDDVSEDKSPPKPLPIQASCETVLYIAGLLLKQCIQSGSYEGGVLVVQSVLCYFQERVSRHERKLAKEEENQLRRQANKGLSHSGFEYDQINFESEESDGDDPDIFLSDDEDLEQKSTGPGMLQSLKSGILPIDLQALYSLCLVGAGGQDHLALSFLENVIMSRELDSFDKEGSNHVGEGSDYDPKWAAFRDTLTSTVSKTSMLASVADMVQREVKDSVWLHRILTIFKAHIKVLDIGHGLDELVCSQDEALRCNTLKILFAATKMIVDCARVDLLSSQETGNNEDDVVQQVIADAVYALKIITRFQHVMWNLGSLDCVFPPTSIITIHILSGAMSVVVQASSSVQDNSLSDSVKDAYLKSRHVISAICHAEEEASMPIQFLESTDVTAPQSWDCFPLPNQWQTPFHEKISLKAHNLCVACCVSSFSGWEPNEFNLDSLRSRGNGNIFGVSLSGPCVAGFLSAKVASEISEQWAHIQKLLPNLETLEFDRLLSKRETAEWYQKIMTNLKKQSSEKGKISSHGENHGISALLSFSMLCLLAAEHSEGNEKYEFIKLSMSVLLPMTEFSIDKKVWESKIGTKVINNQNESRVSYYLDENSRWMGPTKEKEQRATPSGRTQRRNQIPSSVRHETPQRQITNIVKVSTAALLDAWNKNELPVGIALDSEVSEDAKVAMKRVDDAMKNLQMSRTLNALERSSLDVAAALIDVATYQDCHNPFLCVQQAAIFAAMAPKRGNNNEPFKKFLPIERKCSPLEAIVILGRADCLRAIHFLDEAQYLCSWVARECLLHRDSEEIDLPWDSRWMSISILVYMVSATIDETASSLLRADPKAWELGTWENIVKEEIARGKSDAINLAQMPRSLIDDNESNYLPRSNRFDDSIQDPLPHSNYDKDNEPFSTRYDELIQDNAPLSDENNGTIQDAMPSLPSLNGNTMPVQNALSGTNRTHRPVRKALPRARFEEPIQHREGMDVDDMEIDVGGGDVTSFLMKEIEQHRVKVEEDLGYYETGHDGANAEEYDQDLSGAIIEGLGIGNLDADNNPYADVDVVGV